jgi:hypothetical protein
MVAGQTRWNGEKPKGRTAQPEKAGKPAKATRATAQAQRLQLQHLSGVAKMNQATQEKVIPLYLSPSQAWALAQFAKRVGWSEIRQNAIDDAEAENMRDGIEALETALSKAGYSPK